MTKRKIFQRRGAERISDILFRTAILGMVLEFVLVGLAAIVGVGLYRIFLFLFRVKE